MKTVKELCRKEIERRKEDLREDSKRGCKLKDLIKVMRVGEVWETSNGITAAMDEFGVIKFDKGFNSWYTWSLKE